MMAIDMHVHWSPPELIDIYRARSGNAEAMPGALGVFCQACAGGGIATAQ